MPIDIRLAELARFIQTPISLVALGLIIAAWLVVALKTQRFTALMRGLKALPESQRRSAIEAEMGQPLPPEMTPEQWLRYQRNRQYFIAFLCSVVALLVVVVSFLFRTPTITPPPLKVVQAKAEQVIDLVHTRSDDAALWNASMETIKNQVGTLASFKHQLSQMTAQLVEVPKVRRAVNVEATAVGAVALFDSETDSGMRWREQVNLYHTAGEWKIVYLAVNLLEWSTPRIESYAPASLADFVKQGSDEETLGYIPVPGWKLSVIDVSPSAQGTPMKCNVRVRGKDTDAQMLDVYGACGLASGTKLLVLGLASLVDGAARIEQVRFFPR